MNLIVMNNPVHISIVIETFKTNPNIILIYIYILNVILKFAALNIEGTSKQLFVRSVIQDMEHKLS